jgi:hypothetical protein
MLKEIGRQIPIAGAADADRAIAAMGLPTAEMTEAEVIKHLESEQGLANAAEEAIEQVIDATPNKRAADTIKKANEYLGPDANAQQLNHVTNHIRGFAHEAAEFLMRGDNHGLERAIVAFWNGVRDADKLVTQRLPLTPGSDAFALAGWKDEEYWALRAILSNALCGVQKRDCCVSVDAKGALLASGKFLSREQIAEHVQPTGSKTFAVGSLPSVLNAIRRAQ